MFDYSNIQKNYFDKKRDEFLAAIYGGNFENAERIYKDILDKIDTALELSEVDLKAVNQIQHAFRTFRRQINENLSGDIQGIYERIRKRLARDTSEKLKTVEYIEHDAWFQRMGLRKEQFRIMLGTVSTLQITVGCSVFCRRCNEWALPGPRKHFSFDAVVRFIEELFDAGNREFSLYCASDPLDWECGNKSIINILEFMAAHGYKARYGLLTKIPSGAEKKVETLVSMGADIGISITDKNRFKVENIENAVGKKLEVQHDFDKLLIPAGLDEDFSSIKSSITDNYGTEITPEGTFLVIPTFTSALHPTGQRRMPITSDADFFLIKRVGRDALPVEYFKPLKAIDLKDQEITLEKLFEAQIENILLDNGSEELTPPGMMTMHEYFRTYEPGAVKRRKMLLPAVAKGFRKEILSQEKYKENSRQKRYHHFKQRVRDYSESCRMQTVIRYKKNAFSYYLRSITGYLNTHPVEREMIFHLRRKDREKYEKDYHRVFNENERSLDSLLEESEADTFNLFQILIFMLLENPDNKMIQTFISKYPVDSTDCFL